MARILACTSPSRGHLYPLTSILDELARRGHAIAVRTLAPEVALMNTRGFAAAPISEQVAAIELQDWRSRDNYRRISSAHGAGQNWCVVLRVVAPSVYGHQMTELAADVSTSAFSAVAAAGGPA